MIRNGSGCLRAMPRKIPSRLLVLTQGLILSLAWRVNYIVLVWVLVWARVLLLVMMTRMPLQAMHATVATPLSFNRRWKQRTSKTQAHSRPAGCLARDSGEERLSCYKSGGVRSDA